MLKVRRARADEFDQVLDFYTNMIDGMRGTEFDVCWEHDVHPSSAFFLRASADAGEVYVGLVEDGEGATCIASAMVLNGEGDAGYESVSWHVAAAPDEVLVVHVLGTLPAYHGRGFARAMMEACIDVARAAGKRAVRLDTFTTNVRAQSLYESCGFANCGVAKASTTASAAPLSCTSTRCRRLRYASAAFPIDRIQDQLLSVLAGARLLSSAFLRGLRSL